MRRSSSEEDNKKGRRESGAVAIAGFHPVASLWRRQTAFVATADTSAQPAASSASKTVGVLVRFKASRKREARWGGLRVCCLQEVKLVDPSNQSGVSQTSTDCYIATGRACPCDGCTSPLCASFLFLQVQVLGRELQGITHLFQCALINPRLTLKSPDLQPHPARSLQLPL